MKSTGKKAACVSCVADDDGGSCQLVPLVSTKVTAGLEVPNNSSEKQPALHVATDVTGDIEVPSNNSSPQELVPHVAINVPNSIEVPNNSEPQDGNNNGGWKLPALVAGAECIAGIVALLNKPPSSSAPLYIVGEAAIFTANGLEGLAAVLITRNARKYRTFGRIIHFISIAAIILGIVLEVYAYKVKK